MKMYCEMRLHSIIRSARDFERGWVEEVGEAGLEMHCNIPKIFKSVSKVFSIFK
jgi:hypothetical protein